MKLLCVGYFHLAMPVGSRLALFVSPSADDEEVVMGGEEELSPGRL